MTKKSYDKQLETIATHSSALDLYDVAGMSKTDNYRRRLIVGLKCDPAAELVKLLRTTDSDKIKLEILKEFYKRTDPIPRIKEVEADTSDVIDISIISSNGLALPSFA